MNTLNVSPQDKTIPVNSVRFSLVTGCSSGIGLATARTFARAGHLVIATVRSQMDADRLAEVFTNDGIGERLSVIQCDLSDNEQVKSLVTSVQSLIGMNGLANLVNCAGTPAGGPLESLSIKEMKHAMSCNALAPINLTIALLSELQQAQGKAINIGSVSGEAATPLNGLYAGSKAALRSLTEALSAEASIYNVCVTYVNLGSVATPIWRKCLNDSERRAKTNPAYRLSLSRFNALLKLSNASGMSPYNVAEKVLKLSDKHHLAPYYTIGWDALGMVLMARLLPNGLRQWMFKKVLIVHERDFLLRKKKLVPRMFISIDKVKGWGQQVWSRYKAVLSLVFGVGLAAAVNAVIA